MKILITGGAGFIGSNLVSYIDGLNAGHELVVLDDLSTGYESNLAGLETEFIVGSVADPDITRAAAAGAGAIVHLGALGSVPRSIADPVASHVANLTGTLNVLEAARANDAHVIFASSSSVYGANTKLPKSETDWTRPMSPYAVSKLGAEAYVNAYQYAYDLPTLAFRFFNVYGPRQAAGHAYAAVIPRFLDAALNGKPLEIQGDGLQSRDFTHVDTVCAALYAAVERRVTSDGPVNLAFGTCTSLLDLVARIEEELGHSVARVHVEQRVGDVRASQSDGLRIRDLFPEIRPLPLRDGLAGTIAWFQNMKERGDTNDHR